MLLTRLNQSTTNRVRSLLRAGGSQERKLIEADSVAMMAQMLRNPAQVALMPACCTRNALFGDDMRFLPLVNPIVDLPLGFIAPRGHLTQASFSSFIDYTRRASIAPRALPLSLSA